MTMPGDVVAVTDRRPPASSVQPAGLPLVPPTRVRARAASLLGAIRNGLDTRRLFLLAPFAIMAGMVVYVTGPSLPPELLATGVAVIAVAWVLLRANLAGYRIVGMLAAFWCGLSLLAIHGAMFGTAMLVRPLYGTYEMRVDEIVLELDTGVRMIVSHIEPVAEARAAPMRRARIVVADGPPLAPGDLIRAEIRFYAVPGPVVPNGFDTQFHAYFDGVGAYGNSTGPVERLVAGADTAPERIVDAIRRDIARRIDAALAQPSAGISRALITGDQSSVDEVARETMATAGLAHVLSVSGLHLTIVAALVLGTLRLLLAPFTSIHAWLPVKRVAAIGGILAAVGYFAISGGNVAALRSTIMLVLVLGAIVFGRRALTMRNVALAALIVLVTDPASVFRPSFQLSFAAVIGLIAIWELWKPQAETRKSVPRRIVGYLGGIALTSLVAGLATLLFSVYHFQQTSPLGVLGNLLSLPLVGFVTMPAAVIAALAMPFGWEYWPLQVMGWSVDRMLDLGTIVAGFSQGLDYSPLLRPVALGIGLIAFAWFTFLSGWHRLILPTLAIPAIVLFAVDGPPDVLIADTTQATAMRADGGLALVAGRDGSFAVDVWKETYGDPIAATSPLACDSLGCFGVSSAGFSMALAYDPAAFFEDCRAADLVIARRAIPATCTAPVRIGADELARGGVHWLRWQPASRTFEVRPAIPPEPRPWRLQALD